MIILIPVLVIQLLPVLVLALVLMLALMLVLAQENATHDNLHKFIFLLYVHRTRNFADSNLLY